MKKSILRPFIAIASLVLTACSPQNSPSFNQDKVVEIIRALSDDDMQGRGAGQIGGDKAREYLQETVKETQYFDGTRLMPFTFASKAEPSTDRTGNNIISWINGKAALPNARSNPVLIITAHYDHLGNRDGVIYNGADDNASGVAALFAIAESFKALPPKHDIFFVWLDAEEHGLAGAREFVSNNPALMSRPVLNLNLDMVSQNKEGELYMAGGYHNPALIPFIEKAALGTHVTLKFGHDRPEDKGNDWTLQSDHGAFHKAGVPFVYFGVEDHPHYHQPSDDFETLPLAQYSNFVKLIVNAAHILDENLSGLAKPAIAEAD